MSKCDNPDEILHRFLDLANQADRKGIVLFSNFLNMYEINLLHQNENLFYTGFSLYGGYQEAERQMVAFQPDALYYNWEYPISCVQVEPLNHRFSEDLSHRDILGALMHLGIDRSLIGDILIKDKSAYIFCVEKMADFIAKELYKIKHTQVMTQRVKPVDLHIEMQYRTEEGFIASNRLDAFVAQACKLSRAQAAQFILGENVFINGALVTNHNRGLAEGDVVSLRGHGKLRFEAFLNTTKKGRLHIRYAWYV